MKLTDILLTVFSDKEPLSDEDINKNIFIIEYYVSILYPTVIAELGQLKISPIVRYKYLKSMCYKLGKIPNKIWVKINKKEDTKKKKNKLDKESMLLLSNKYTLDRKDIMFFRKSPSSVPIIEEMKNIEKN